MERIAIIGLGFMGGSLAKAIRQKSKASITAVDIDEQQIKQALTDGVIQNGFTQIKEVKWDSFDMVIFCTPVHLTVNYMQEIDGKLKEGCIVTDIGSTKQQVMEIAKEVSYNFIGAHPMVGSEKSGYLHSKAHLFENAYFILTPTDSSSLRIVAELTKLIVAIGAIPIELKPEQHDLYTAVISHVPHIVASALVNLVNDFHSEDETILKLAAGGFKDITRIASSKPELWQHISLSNQAKITEVLNSLINNLRTYQDWLQNIEQEQIYAYFATAKETRDQLHDTVDTDIPNQYYLIVDVEDKPGMIAHIANLFYEKGINIKNIGIIHNREFEDGCLKIILENKKEQLLAYQLLLNRSYAVYL